MTVILANGDFPSVASEGYRLLTIAERVVACDGAALKFRRAFNCAPDFIVGDLDSIAGDFEGSQVVRFADQDTNDLEKAIHFCRDRGWNDLIVVGASGGREDHLLGNIFRAMALGVDLVTDTGRFIPFAGRRELDTRVGAAISVFATDPSTRIESEGLAWPLAGVRFDTLYRGTLNRAIASRVILTASLPSLVFIENDEINS